MIAFKRMVSGLIAVFVLLASYGVSLSHGEEEHGEEKKAEKRIFTKHFQESLFDITENAEFSVEILLDDSEYDIGKDVVGIVLHGSDDGDVKGAELIISRKNRERGEPLPGSPSITDKGNGLYIISGLDLKEKGRWELSITAKKGPVTDRVLFLFPDVLKEKYPKGRYSP